MRGAGDSHHNHVLEASLSMHYAHQNHDSHAGAETAVVSDQNTAAGAAAADVEVSHATAMAVHHHHPNAANEAAARAANAMRDFGQIPHQHQIVQLHSRTNDTVNHEHDNYHQQHQIKQRQ